MQIHDRIDGVRAQWATERPDLDTSPLMVIGRILRVEHLASIEMRRTFRKYGLDRGRFDVLATLRRSGAPYRLTPTRLYEDLMLTSGAMTHRVDALERAGLVERVPDRQDRRSAPVALTPKGRSVIDRLMEEHMQVEAALMAHLSTAEQSALAELLKKLLQAKEDSIDHP